MATRKEVTPIDYGQTDQKLMVRGHEQEPNGDELVVPAPAVLEPHYPTTRGEWATFAVQTVRYDDGEVSGHRLLIDGWAVMEEWERPIEQRIMRELFRRTAVQHPTVLIGGEGMGYATRTALEEANSRGGARIIVVELHPEVLRRGERRARNYLASLPIEDAGRINVEFKLGDFRDIIEQLPDDSIDAARIDLFPLSPEEKDIDSFVDIPRLIRKLKASAVISPFIGHEDRPTDRQLQYTRDETGGKLFGHEEWDPVYGIHPPRDSYFPGRRISIGFWGRPDKTIVDFRASGGK